MRPEYQIPKDQLDALLKTRDGMAATPAPIKQYGLTVSPMLIAIGMTLACVIGFVGGLFPAIRAARLPVASALRAI